jgi:hypothetical protein
MRECRIEFLQNGAQVDLKVTPPGGGAHIIPMPQRLLDGLNIPPAALEEMRRGTAPDALVDDVAEKVSAWLQRADPGADPVDLNLGHILGLGQHPPDPVRLVFSTESVNDDQLRYRLTDLPLELASPAGDLIPFAWQPNVSSVVHVLRKTTASVAPAGRVWPLKVLLVRSNPETLGGAVVPPAQRVRDHILGLDLPAGSVVVDVLSRGEGPGLPTVGMPTKDDLAKQLLLGYDILVYLGHADLREGPAGAIPLGELQLESQDGQVADPMDARALSMLLQRAPVPLVLLVGCLTAAEIMNLQPVDRDRLMTEDLPRWMRGAHGLAQALVAGQSAVQCVVGMRYRVEIDDAVLFLDKFFETLLRGNLVPRPARKDRAGDVEAAVHDARSHLSVVRTRLAGAAPMVLRTATSEPMFPFLRTDPPAPARQLPDEITTLRRNLWNLLSTIPVSGAAPHDQVIALLEIEEQRLRAAVAPTPLLLPGRMEVSPDPALTLDLEQHVTVPVHLFGDLPPFVRLAGWVGVVSGVAGRVIQINPAPDLSQNGIRLLVGVPPTANGMNFIITAPDGATAALAGDTLTNGVLMEVTFAVPPVVPSCVEVGVNAAATVRNEVGIAGGGVAFQENVAPVCAGTNAIVLPPP